MKEMLRIGEVADLMGISVQTLRYYSKIDLLQPTSIDESTGYRYYSVDQIHFLDRIKYLQNFELSLKEIKEILDSNDISMLLDTMQKRQDELKVEAQKIQNAIENIEWYKHYFTYIDSGYKNHLSIIRNLPERYMIVTKCDKEKSKKEWHMDLHKLVHSQQNISLKVLRRYSYILDYDSIQNEELDPKYLGLFVHELPNYLSADIITLPAGNYFCFKARILQKTWSAGPAKKYFKDKAIPSIIIASEFEDNLREYTDCIYEVQLYCEK